MPTQVVRQVVDGLVSLSRFLPQRHQHDVVKIAGKPVAEFVRLVTARLSDRRPP
jgi:hypothetical protein